MKTKTEDVIASSETKMVELLPLFMMAKKKYGVNIVDFHSVASFIAELMKHLSTEKLKYELAKGEGVLDAEMHEELQRRNIASAFIGSYDNSVDVEVML